MFGMYSEVFRSERRNPCGLEFSGRRRGKLEAWVGLKQTERRHECLSPEDTRCKAGEVRLCGLCWGGWHDRASLSGNSERYMFDELIVEGLEILCQG